MIPYLKATGDSRNAMVMLPIVAIVLLASLTHVRGLDNAFVAGDFDFLILAGPGAGRESATPGSDRLRHTGAVVDDLAPFDMPSS